ncbi:MAG: hypothetical protein NTV89_07140 [Proteobacteria bacterium]|nr:hypothetical protein [Pseudomonadota bacterium]
MNKSIYTVLGLAVLFGALFAPGGTKEAPAQVQVNIGIVAPPPLQFAAPPDVYVVPSGSSYVYMVPDYDGVYFYGGSWYRTYNNHWFRSSHYNGGWDYIEQSRVPQVIVVVPPEYIHYVPSGYYRIHYNDLYSNWQTWDQGRYWDRYDWYTNERRDDIRRERYNRIDMDRQQRGVQTLQHQQGSQQRGVQQPQQYNVQKQKQHVQKQQKQHVQKQQKQHVQKQQKQHVQKQQKQHVQKQQQQQNQKVQKHSQQQQPKQQKQQHQQSNNKDKEIK